MAVLTVSTVCLTERGLAVLSVMFCPLLNTGQPSTQSPSRRKFHGPLRLKVFATIAFHRSYAEEDCLPVPFAVVILE
ncbi:hypothetical protein F5Y19DRAFT_445526 [Xylariaceae sp. FL1651]|nr:hypothetical protein F5Y19DRAFT_445526 [Xylariaceae sp. FL1651]